MSRARMTFRTNSAEETAALGRVLGAVLWAGDFLALHGQLGAGKTALVRGIAGGLGLDERAVSSPTFVIAAEYSQAAERPAAPAVPPVASLVHVDAYRLTSEEDLESAGWDRAADGSAVVAVEWAERIPVALRRASDEGRSLAEVRIEATGADSRRIELDAPAGWARRPGWNTLAARAETASEPRDWTTCPITGKPVSPTSATWPFADEQARLADLHRWLSGAYRVGGDRDGEE